MLVPLYRTLSDLGSPLITLYLRRRLRQGREDKSRFQERLGEASIPRPHGRLIWCHAASVGEANSLLALVNKLRLETPKTNILITTGTVTSAKMIAERLPPAVLHQYVPVDRLKYVKKFLNHWRPDLVLWVESELWPNMLLSLKSRSSPVVLLNGRMSDRSYRHWRFAPGLAREILSSFALCLTQSEEEQRRFSALGAPHVRSLGNMKYSAEPLPFQSEDLKELRQQIGARRVWLLASSHPGEEALALETHRELIKKWPDLLTIIAPRHTHRSDEIALLIKQHQYLYARRTHNQNIEKTTSIYLADTMGELGLLYRLSPIVVIGGTLQAIGGHNPIEPAQLGAAIIFGPYTQNFSVIVADFISHRAALCCQASSDLVSLLETFLSNEKQRNDYAEAARKLAETKSHVLQDILVQLEPWLTKVNRGIS